MEDVNETPNKEQAQASILERIVSLQAKIDYFASSAASHHSTWYEAYEYDMKEFMAACDEKYMLEKKLLLAN